LQTSTKSKGLPVPGEGSQGDWASALERRRFRRRTWMRKWRARPANQRIESERRKGWAISHKERRAAGPCAHYLSDRGRVLCAFCRTAPPRVLVERLAIVPPNDRFVKVLVPYCGTC
jgi:hypothetical protein